MNACNHRNQPFGLLCALMNSADIDLARIRTAKSDVPVELLGESHEACRLAIGTTCLVLYAGDVVPCMPAMSALKLRKQNLSSVSSAETGLGHAPDQNPFI